jgi:hypothetical protein
MKITEMAQIFGLHFSTVQVMTKNVLAFFWGDFFTDSSGHPDAYICYDAYDAYMHTYVRRQKYDG